MSCQLLEFLELAWKKGKANYPIRSSLIYPAFFPAQVMFRNASWLTGSRLINLLRTDCFRR